MRDVINMRVKHLFNLQVLFDKKGMYSINQVKKVLRAENIRVYFNGSVIVVIVLLYNIFRIYPRLLQPKNCPFFKIVYDGFEILS